MYTFSSFIKYKVNGKVYTSYETDNADCKVVFSADDDRITASVIPSTKIELIEFKLDTKRAYKKGDVFFSNGYQSWSTSWEVQKENILKNTNPIANISAWSKNAV